MRERREDNQCVAPEKEGKDSVRTGQVGMDGPCGTRHPLYLQEGGGLVWKEVQKWEVEGISSDGFNFLCEARREVIPDRI